MFRRIHSVQKGYKGMRLVIQGQLVYSNFGEVEASLGYMQTLGKGGRKRLVNHISKGHMLKLEC